MLSLQGQSSGRHLLSGIKDSRMNWTEQREQRLQAKLDAVEEELAEDERIVARRANLDSRRLIVYEERPAYAAPIIVVAADELTEKEAPTAYVHS